MKTQECRGQVQLLHGRPHPVRLGLSAGYSTLPGQLPANAPAGQPMMVPELGSLTWEARMGFVALWPGLTPAVSDI